MTRDTILPTPRNSYQTIHGKVEGKEIEALKGTRVGAVERSGLLWREVSPASVTSGYQFDLSNSHPLTRKSLFPIILRMGEGKSVNRSAGLTMKENVIAQDTCRGRGLRQTPAWRHATLGLATKDSTKIKGTKTKQKTRKNRDEKLLMKGRGRAPTSSSNNPSPLPTRDGRVTRGAGWNSLLDDGKDNTVEQVVSKGYYGQVGEDRGGRVVMWGIQEPTGAVIDPPDWSDTARAQPTNQPGAHVNTVRVNVAS
ncbi:hypothetical protein Pmani_006330 [Petrolisthes manimaculis]|uniref:Uncharacterized protein n=1 Tax=Petrolisthes manimaculis TaxID=1843537 RepID=A0AAE1QD36_9EUCA|nr:hypothetical protein Pmani_006330 [Petrolisthes manimaculis]